MKNDWIISQRWHDLIFINLKCDFDMLRALIPSCLEIDLFENDSYLSLVPFKMSEVRFSFFPVIPMSQLWELNIRTYVKYKGKPGIYFITLDCDHLFGTWIARSFFGLPYRYKKMKGHVKKNDYFLESDSGFSLGVSLRDTRKKSTFDSWILERYSLFNLNKKGLFEGIVEHGPWSGLREVEKKSMSFLPFLESFNLKLTEQPSSIFYCPGTRVGFKPFIKRESFHF